MARPTSMVALDLSVIGTDECWRVIIRGNLLPIILRETEAHALLAKMLVNPDVIPEKMTRSSG